MSYPHYPQGCPQCPFDLWLKRKGKYNLGDREERFSTVCLWIKVGIVGIKDIRKEVARPWASQKPNGREEERGL